MAHTHQMLKDVQDRLSKIEGHIKGIQRMVEEEKPCEDILHQLAAVQSALAKTGRVLFEDHFQHCIVDKASDKELVAELQRFKELLYTFSKGLH